MDVNTVYGIVSLNSEQVLTLLLMRMTLRGASRDFFFFFFLGGGGGAICSLRRELSPTPTLKRPGHNLVQLTCNIIIVHYMVRRDSSAIKLDKVKVAFVLALFY